MSTPVPTGPACAEGGHDPTAADLRETGYLDFSAPAVAALLERVTAGAASPTDAVARWFTAVRDEVRYDPYALPSNAEDYRASAVVGAGRGYCVPKAVLLVAGCRALGIPSRLGFADVRNHLQTDRLREQMGSDVFRYHGFGVLWIEGRWVKASPAFNRELCERVGVAPLDFDGRRDALLHQFSADGGKYMEYLVDHGAYTDLPLDEILDAYRVHYPRALWAS